VDYSGGSPSVRHSDSTASYPIDVARELQIHGHLDGELAGLSVWRLGSCPYNDAMHLFDLGA
jgi:hypothetical protein